MKQDSRQTAFARAVSDSDPNKGAITQRDVLSTLSFIRPWTMRTTSKVRVGSPADGGYVVPGVALTCDGVVSIGGDDDLSFDTALAERGAIVVAVDHANRRGSSGHSRIRWVRKRWSARAGKTTVSLSSLGKEPSLRGTNNRLLKFDAGRDEYDALLGGRLEDLRCYDVIVGRYQNLESLGDRTAHATIREVFSRLHSTHCPVHFHANNSFGVSLVAGVVVAKSVEVSYLRRDLDQFPQCASPNPGPLDRPNDPRRPELILSVF